MLNSKSANEELESMMSKLYDEYLKAKAEDKDACFKRWEAATKLWNERLKTENDYLIREDQNKIECEKFDYEKQIQEQRRIDEIKAKRTDVVINSIFKGMQIGLAAGGMYTQAVQTRYNLIETDSISKAATRATNNMWANWLNGK